MNQTRSLYKPVSITTMLTTSCIIVIFVSGVLVSGSPLGLSPDGPLQPDKAEETELRTHNDLLARIVRNVQHHDHRSGSGQHLLDHILREVEKGHVNSAQMHHWMNEIDHALADGSLTQAQVDVFILQLQHHMPHTSSDTGCYDARTFDDDEAHMLHRRLARHGPHSENLLDHILHEVRKGHVTGTSLDHWKTEINHAVKEGDLTPDDVNEFLAEFKGLVPGGMTDWCCIFG